MDKKTDHLDVFDPQRWGLPAEAVDDLANRLRRVWERFRHCFKTKTRNTADYAWFYLRGLLTMAKRRNFANIARRVIDLDDDGQPVLARELAAVYVRLPLVGPGGL